AASASFPDADSALVSIKLTVPNGDFTDKATALPSTLVLANAGVTAGMIVPVTNIMAVMTDATVSP
ncbi:MAG TPA: hypothetical protein VFU58_07000, partial [Candidatus Nitrosotalea sp.]|nr:hypothetical protein [Candidatus Nitrosotalea sp.]